MKRMFCTTRRGCDWSWQCDVVHCWPGSQVSMYRIRRSPPPLSGPLPPPSRTTSALVFTTLAVACMVIVTGRGPQENVMMPPSATAATTAAEVQLAAVPSPITWAGCEASAGCPAAGTGACPDGLPGSGRLRGGAGRAGVWVGRGDGLGEAEVFGGPLGRARPVLAAVALPGPVPQAAAARAVAVRAHAASNVPKPPRARMAPHVRPRRPWAAANGITAAREPGSAGLGEGGGGGFGVEEAVAEVAQGVGEEAGDVHL